MKRCFLKWILASALLLSGCPKKPDALALPPVGLAGSGQHLNTKSAEKEPVVLKGIAKEVISEQGVTYLLLESDGEQTSVWVALIDTQVSVGDRLIIDGEVEMNDFFSKSLKRRFKQVIFGKVTRKN